MPTLTPASAEELAEILKQAASQSNTVSAFGNNSKRLMGGPLFRSDIVVSTAGLRQMLQYETHDLTVSVGAGMPFTELQAILARSRQMIALDPPFAAQATVGGVVASNSSGPLRRGFGTARDLVIGMTFATLEGKLINTGGMVVKNVAGLDMGKLMIGGFGTLGVMTSINFRVHSLPQETRTFVATFADLDSAIQKRNAIVKGVLQPMAVDLVSPVAAARLNLRGYALVIRAGGSRVVLDRYSRELDAEEITGEQEIALWQAIREFTPEFLRRQPAGIVLRVSTTLQDVGLLFRNISGAAISRVASGVTYVYQSGWQPVPALSKLAKERGWSTIVEFAPDQIRSTKELWLEQASENEANTFAMMKKIKHMFDPQNLLNRSRLYGRI